jgi:BirA family biotin operon repressor/biotin-[acetyl-CoA-carboxylase] ligase
MPLWLAPLPRHHARAQTVNPIEQPLQWGAEALWEQLSPQLPGLSIEVVARIGSTNTALLERARVAPLHDDSGEPVQVRQSVESRAFGRRAADLQPCLLVAEHQTHGRGRQGRIWQASPGASLTFSLALALGPRDWSGLSLAVGVALADALDPWPDGHAPRPQHVAVKWPNDLWLVDATGHGRKLGGILIETVPAGAKRLAVIGVGINVLPLAGGEAIGGYASVQEFDGQASAPRVLAQMAKPLVDAVQRFEREGFEGFAAAYGRRDLLRGRAVRTTQADVPEGQAEGVSDTGALLVRTPDGVLHPVGSGEVSVRLQPESPES